MAELNLTPERIEFVEASVANGRFASTDEVIAHALDLMREREVRRAEFVAMLDEVRAEADDKGWVAIEDLDRELSDIIAAADGRD